MVEMAKIVEMVEMAEMVEKVNMTEMAGNEATQSR